MGTCMSGNSILPCAVWGWELSGPYSCISACLVEELLELLEEHSRECGGDSWGLMWLCSTAHMVVYYRACELH